MEGITVNKDLLIAVLLTVVIHLCVAFARIPADQRAVHMKAEPNRSLAVSFVSTFSEIEKKELPVTRPAEAKQTVIEKKEKPVIKEPVHKESAVTQIRKTNIPKRQETISTDTAIAVASRVSSPSPPAAAPLQKEAVPVSRAVPRYMENDPPVYPPVARRRGYEGTVLLSVHIGADGTVVESRVKESSGYPILDRAALKTVGRWKFEPASRASVPFAMWVDVPVRFVLKQGS